MAETTTQKESRVKKTLINAKVNLIFYFLTLALSFFSRKIFLDCLGANFIGLTGTLQNLLGFLNLAELGIGGAIGYLLYKPLYEKDQTKITEIISVMGFLYRWIGCIILGGGIILSLFLPLIFPSNSTGFNYQIIYFAYYSFLISSLIGYFINYRQNLLGADQRNYVVTAYFQTMNIVKMLIQMALAYYTGSYYLWIIIELTFGIIYSIILNWKINQTYPWLKASIKTGKKCFKQYPEVITKTKQLFIHQITSLITTRLNGILIYAYVSLQMVAYYSNYVVIIDKVFALIYNAMGGASASIGNLVAENNIDKTRSVFFEIATLNLYVGGIAMFSIFTMSNGLISVWLGPEYMIPIWMIVPSYVKYYCDFTTSNLGTFLYCHGLFYDVWAPVIESVICIAASIGLGYYFGLVGVLSGVMISNIIINLCWKSYFLFTKGLKLEYWKFWTFFFKNVCIQAAIGIAVIFLYDVKFESFPNWWQLILNTIFVCGTFAVLVTLAYIIAFKRFRIFITKRIPQMFMRQPKLQ